MSWDLFFSLLFLTSSETSEIETTTSHMTRACLEMNRKLSAYNLVKKNKNHTRSQEEQKSYSSSRRTKIILFVKTRTEQKEKSLIANKHDMFSQQDKVIATSRLWEERVVKLITWRVTGIWTRVRFTEIVIYGQLKEEQQLNIRGKRKKAMPVSCHVSCCRAVVVD